MRDIIAYDAKQCPDGVVLSRCAGGMVTEYVARNWDEMANWLLEQPSKNTIVFNVVFNLVDFVNTLFNLLPEDIDRNSDRIFYQECKVFHVPGRYLGIGKHIQINNSNIYQRAEINLQSLKWWVSEDEEEPTDVKSIWLLGNKILFALSKLGFTPTKLTSPVAVFVECFLKSALQYPTIYSFNHDKFQAMEYASEMMRYEWRSAYQLGYFDKVYSYDIISAYPATMAILPGMDGCRCEYAADSPLEWADWGIMKGKVSITSEISPLVYETSSGDRINPRGRWDGYFTTGEIRLIEKYGIGKFSMLDGWFFKFNKYYPYSKAMKALFNWKNDTDLRVSTIAKKMAQGLSGKLDEDRQDGTKGDFYNPVLAAIVRSHCRIKVADFIYRNELQNDLVAVTVDGLLSTKGVNIESSNIMGNWRNEGNSPALVLSKGNIWRPGKRPQGISFDQITKAVNTNPDTSYYEISDNGKIRDIDLMLLDPHDREYEKPILCGGDLLGKPIKSKAVRVR